MVDYRVGDVVTFAKRADAASATGWGNPNRFNKGDTAEVTRVNKNRITVKVNCVRTFPSYGGNTESVEGTYSFNVDRDVLETPNGEKWDESEKPKRRKIGEVPEGMISPEDPRIQWLWEDAEKVANNSYYCSQYDHMADKLGIPGRVRDIRVDLLVNGIKVYGDVKARSEKEAVKLFKEKLGVSE